MAERIGLYGGSFNPIHHGHLIIARSLAETLGMDRVILLPSRTPPHKTGAKLAPVADRASMVRAAIADDPLFAFSDHDLKCEGLSYTVNTVHHFHQTMPDAKLFWIVGADSLLELHTWYQPERIVELCNVATARRPGSTLGELPELSQLLGKEAVADLLRNAIETPEIDISATDIRERVKRGAPIRYLVPESVEQYVRTHNLYREDG